MARQQPPPPVNFDQENSQMGVDPLSFNNCTGNEDQEWHFKQSRTYQETQIAPDLISEPGIEEIHPYSSASGLWNNDASFDSYWSFMPFLSQLETLPSDFDLSNLE